jgi:predicted TPR repeat methyltransferase
MSDERLRAIYAATDTAELQQRYDAWATEYDADLESLSYRAPKAGAEQCHRVAGPQATVLDAGCGTGLVGARLAELGVGHLVGFDLSAEMLRCAGERGVYAELVQGSLLAPLPFHAQRFDAVVSVGTFTFGHVGPEALPHLPAVVRPDGFVVMTFRDDVMSEMGFDLAAQRLERDGIWRLEDRSDPAPLIVEDGVGADMRVWTWRVLG